MRRMARPYSQQYAAQREKRVSKPRRSSRWTVLTTPLLQQIAALLLMAVGVITLLSLFHITTGRWADTWARLLRWLLGWGAYPIALIFLIGGLLWLQVLLDRPVKWRWRPIVGAELVLIGLLGLTHMLMGQHDPWALIYTEWGGGLVGWSLTVLLRTYLGLPLSIALLSALTLLGLGLAFDLTATGLRQWLASLRVSGARGPEMARPQTSTRTWEGVHTQHARPELGVVIHRATSAEPTITSERLRPSASAPARVSALDTAEASPVSPARSARISATARAEPAAQTLPTTITPRPEPQTQTTVKMPMPPQPATMPTQQYMLPPIDLLDPPSESAMTDEEIRTKSRIIEQTLAQFGLPVEVTEVRVGPAVTQFGIKPGYVERGGAVERKVRVNQISALADDLALALAAPRLRVEAPVPGRAVVGIEVPNTSIQIVKLREILETEEFQRRKSPLTFALGRDVAGEPVVADLAKMPHLLIAGTTGSGKSVCIRAIAVCLICNNTPEQLRLVMIDPKMVELTRFNGIPHLYGRAEVDLERIVKVLRWVAAEMEDRYKRFASAIARNLDDYNQIMKQAGEPTLPRIVVLIDELADLMMLAPDEVERTICRIAQMARATGIHLVVATQRPSVDVVTGLIKANFPARISFATASQTDSRVILDMPGAETLLGRGDMLYLAADAGHPVRVQGCYVSEEELERVVQFWRSQNVPVEEEAPWERMIRPVVAGQASDESVDPDLLEQAIELVRKTGSASASLLQRRLRIGHPRAARLMQMMEEMGIIGPPEAAGRTRRVIIGGEGNK